MMIAELVQELSLFGCPIWKKRCVISLHLASLRALCCAGHLRALSEVRHSERSGSSAIDLV